MSQNDCVTTLTTEDLCHQLNRIIFLEWHLAFPWPDPLTYILKLNFKYFSSQSFPAP